MKKEKQSCKKKVGFLGGTFDPIHLGHLTLAIEIQEKRRLDVIYFCPAHLSPFKQKTSPHALGVHRMQMLQLAIQDIPYFSSLSIELERGSISYTVDTLEDLTQREKSDFFLLLGKNIVPHLDKWKDIDKVLTLATPLVGVPFAWDKKEIYHLPSFIRSAVERGVTPISTMEISSTLVRKRLQQGLYCGHLLPGKVLDYVYANHLYST